MIKVAEHAPARGSLYGIGIAVGMLAGFINTRLGVELDLSVSLLGWLLISLIAVVVLHEGLHAGVAALLGHKPLFGLKPPLVYVTFTDKLPRGHYILTAIAPFVILNLLFGFLYAQGPLNPFSHLCLIVNSIGSVGDIWVALKLAGGPGGALIQDTKSGFEVWLDDEPAKSNPAMPKEA